MLNRLRFAATGDMDPISNFRFDVSTKNGISSSNGSSKIDTGNAISSS